MFQSLFYMWCALNSFTPHVNLNQTIGYGKDMYILKLIMVIVSELWWAFRRSRRFVDVIYFSVVLSIMVALLLFEIKLN